MRNGLISRSRGPQVNGRVEGLGGETRRDRLTRLWREPIAYGDRVLYASWELPAAASPCMNSSFFRTTLPRVSLHPLRLPWSSATTCRTSPRSHGTRSTTHPAAPVTSTLTTPFRALNFHTSNLTAASLHFILSEPQTTYTMPPKRAAASKRKAETPSEDEQEPLSQSDAESEQEERVAKKRKTTSKAKATAGRAKGPTATKGSAKAKASPSQSQSQSQNGGGQANDGPAQPTNKVLPTQISFPEKSEDTVRVAAWNICGLAAAQKKVSPSVAVCHL